MLREIVSDYIEKGNTLITTKADGGATVFTLFIANVLLRKDKVVVYYNPTAEICAHFVKKYYPRVYKSVMFVNSPLQDFIKFIEHMGSSMDYLIMDPADVTMLNRKIIPTISDVLKSKGTKLICTSQIRVDPSKGGQVYSTIEELNKKYSGSIFQNSIWIRDVTEENSIYASRYVDIFDKYRVGNRYKCRCLAKFSKTSGTVME